MAASPPLFSVSIVESDRDATFPLIGSTIVGLHNVAYNVVVSWNADCIVGPCQFRLHIDGRFVGYTRVRDVGECESSYVVFDGFLMTRGSTENARAVMEYRKFKFIDAHTVEPTANAQVNEHMGRIQVDVYEFQRGIELQRNDARPQRQFYGDRAWDGIGLGDGKKTSQCLTTGCGETFYKTENFVTKFRRPGKAVGPAIFSRAIRYDTAASLVLAGILKTSQHKHIIDWAISKISGKEDKTREEKGETREEGELQSWAPIKKEEESDVLEIIDLSGPSPVLYTYPKDRVHEVCDLTGESAVWLEDSRSQPDMIDLTGSSKDEITDRLADCSLEGPSEIEIEYMEIDSDY